MIKKLLNISCRHATFLAGKKEEGKISMPDNMRLKIHYTICTGCRLFARQTSFICKHAGHAQEHSTLSLSPEAKERMKAVIGS